MNGRTARLINAVTARLSPAARNALKREWLAAPENERSKIRGRLRHALAHMVIYTPTVEECAEAQRVI
jgi:hypothetical protein